MMTPEERRERDARIVRMRHDGVTLVEIAGAVGLCSDRVWQIIRRDAPELITPRQNPTAPATRGHEGVMSAIDTIRAGASPKAVARSLGISRAELARRMAEAAGIGGDR